ncbi:MAG: cbb3-type cytochrome c oxidase subunit I [Planctomycetes bacterium]|nr:cbb3-type cytochrome c oxidase subunit I [Planctomycetota bacterium]
MANGSPPARRAVPPEPSVNSIGFSRLLVQKKYWPIHLIFVAAVSIIGVGYLAMETYAGAPPTADFVAPDGAIVFSVSDIERGKEVFHSRALMSYGSFWGDGAERGPDFTAEALNHTAQAMTEYYEAKRARDSGLSQEDHDIITARVRREIQYNGWNEGAGTIQVSDAQAYAFTRLNEHYRRVFTDPDYPEAFHPTDYISDKEDLRALTAYFFWGGWVSGAHRPGKDYSYTHNWPYDPLAGNSPTQSTIVWSVLSILALFLGIGSVLYVYGQLRNIGDPFDSNENASLILTTKELESGLEEVRPSQRLVYKFFAFAMVVFLIQVLAGVLSANDFVRTDRMLGIDIAKWFPITVVRSWHIILQIFWFFVCWIGYTIFFLPELSRVPRGQTFLINLLFGLAVLVGAGVLFGIYLGPQGYLNEQLAYWLGSQGWEFMELGRLWQIVLLGAFVLWVFIIYRAVRPWLSRFNAWSVPAWLLYGSGIMVAFLFFGMMVSPRQNFAISDFWRWMVVHMWVEATFEVFTTVVIGYLLVKMGVVRRAVAERVIFLAVALFLLTALIGISHNFYWIAKPTPIIALGSVFSTLQVLPLLLLTLDAWRTRLEMRRARGAVNQGHQKIALDGVWMFVLAVNFWNVFGAGVFGSLINLPIVNYYEHGTYLTGNHAHAAMFGVKGNVAIGGMLFCCRHLFRRSAWNEKLVRVVFWSLQIGLALMMFLALFPLGVYQLNIVLTDGLAQARTQEVVTGSIWSRLVYLRTIGGTLFLVGGVLPLAWFVLSRFRKLVPESDRPDSEWDPTQRDIVEDSSVILP